MMGKMNEPYNPMWMVLKEGGPFHTKDHLESYIENRLIPTSQIEKTKN